MPILVVCDVGWRSAACSMKWLSTSKMWLSWQTVSEWYTLYCYIYPDKQSMSTKLPIFWDVRWNIICNLFLCNRLAIPSRSEPSNLSLHRSLTYAPTGPGPSFSSMLFWNMKFIVMFCGHAYPTGTALIVLRMCHHSAFSYYIHCPYGSYILCVCSRQQYHDLHYLCLVPCPSSTDSTVDLDQCSWNDLCDFIMFHKPMTTDIPHNHSPKRIIIRYHDHRLPKWFLQSVSSAAHGGWRADV